MKEKVNANSSTEAAVPAEERTKEVISLDRLLPGKMRVIAIVLAATGEVLQRDCYAPDGDVFSDLMGVYDGELWLRTIKWAQSPSMDAEMRLRWEPMGVTSDEVERISIFTWPDGNPVQVFVDSIGT